MQYELGFIGAGNMAEAIARAAIDRQILSASQMIAFDPTPQRVKLFSEMGIASAADNAGVIRQSRQVLIAVKPQVMAQAAGDLGRHITDQQVVISIMAGITSQRLGEAIGRPTRVVRVMPNTPLMVGCGMAGIATGADARAGDEDLAMRLFGAAGEAVLVKESAIDAITAVSGSGPAYLFYLAEAMQEAARELGLAEHAPLLVRQTLFGAATLLAKSGEEPTQLRAKVTSPGGTTEAACKQLDLHRVRQQIISAVKAAEARSRELGKT